MTGFLAHRANIATTISKQKEKLNMQVLLHVGYLVKTLCIHISSVFFALTETKSGKHFEIAHVGRINGLGTWPVYQMS